MDSSDAPTSANGLPLSDFKYQLLTNQRIPDVVAAWNQFIQKVTDSGLKDLLKALPFSAPVSLRTTTATTTATTTTTAEQTTDEDIIIPLLTFTDTINVAVPSAEEGVALANRLKILWANASGKYRGRRDPTGFVGTSASSETNARQCRFQLIHFNSQQF